MSTNKKAKNTDEAWKIQETYGTQPHGWIQWKGTNVCMDIHCKCGMLTHIDADFAYHVKCPHLPVESMGAQKCIEISKTCVEALSTGEGGEK